MNDMNAIDWIAAILVIIGALNWGLVGISSFSGISYNWDLVALVFGGIPLLAAVIFVLVGLSGVWVLYRLFTKS